MSERFARNSRKLFLLGAVCLLTAAPVQAQVLHPDGPLPSFEVATIKPDKGYRICPPVPWGTGHVACIPGVIPMRYLITQVYGLAMPYITESPSMLVFGGPKWIDKEGYTIQGKIPDDLFAGMQHMSFDESRKMVWLMFQSLLAERFKLKVHFETREMPVYELVTIKGGLQATKNKDDDPARHATIIAFPNRTPQLTVQNMSMAEFAKDIYTGLLNGLKRPVIDKTGIEGRYTFKIRFAPEGTMYENTSPSHPGPYDEPDFFTAIQAVGLKLVPAKGPVEVVVIDSIERPSEN